jgi:HPt (histidine-containing phosphotransfer) domain-containing protein
MLPSHNIANASLHHWLVVRPEPAGQFTAQLLGLPELAATASSREEAIEQVRARIGEWIAQERLTLAEIPSENPVMKWFGWAKDDPEYDVFLAEMRRYREEVDQREPLE